MQGLTSQPNRASYTRCASSTHISLSTLFLPTTVPLFRSETSVCASSSRGLLSDLLIAVGEKIVRDCPMLEGTKISVSDVKDEIIIQGTDIEKVSQSAASITDKTRVKDKDVGFSRP